MKRSASSIRLQARNQNQQAYMDALDEYDIVIATGPPGTAKSLIAVYKALQHLERGEIEKIYFIKPTAKVQGETDLGALPGTLEEKVCPYLMSLKDSLKVFMHSATADKLIRDRLIEYIPLAYLRGRTLDRCFIIGDEMQNLTAHSAFTLLSRIGEDTVVALNGDIVQRDLKSTFGTDGLSDVVRRLAGTELVAHIEFGFDDIERSFVARQVIHAYSDLYTSTPKARSHSSPRLSE